MSKLLRVAIAAILIFPSGTYGDTSELTVSISISGPVDDLIPLLEQLKEMGIGEGSTTISNSSVEVQFHSIASKEDGTLAAVKPKPVTNFTGATISPQKVKAGKSTLLSAEISDPDRRVDTVEASLKGHTQTWIDLYDNGTRGDVISGDGTWSVLLAVPESAAGGQYSIIFSAYDTNGDPVQLTTSSGKKVPMTLRSSLLVVH